MKRFLIALALFSIQASCFAQAANAVPEKTIEVILGIDKVERLNFPPSTNVQIGNSSILSYELIPQKREVTFKGIKTGKTSFIIRNTKGDIKARYLVRITANALSKTVKELKEYLGDVEGLEIGIKGDNVYVGGKIVVPGDIGRVVVILNREKYNEVIRLVELSPHTQQIIAERMQDEIQNSGMKNVTVRVVNKIFWLEGIVTSKAQHDHVMKIAKAYIPENIKSLGQKSNEIQAIEKSIIEEMIQIRPQDKPAPQPKMVKVTAQFVELTKNYSRIFGFKWTPLIAGDGGTINVGKGDGGVTTSSQGTLTATISNLFPKLSTAKSAGHARVIQSAVLVTKDGVAGKVDNETQTPFSIGTGDFAKSEKAISGFKLNVTPNIMAQEKINLKLGISVGTTVGSPPETLTRSLSTEVVVKSKESAVIGGIAINKSSTSFDKDPPFGQDSFENGTPLFNFLRSKSHLNDKSQFVVFVTPEVIDSASTGTEEIKRKFRKRRR